MKTMKKAIVGIIIVALVIGLAGCGPSREQQASTAMKMTFDNFKAGKFDQSEIDSLTQGFDGVGMSAAGEQDLVNAVKNMLTKISYDIKSSTADKNDPNKFIINADVETVDGNALFTSDASLDAAVNVMFDMIVKNGEDTTVASAAGMDAWAKQIYEDSKTAQATKSLNINFTLSYDKTKNLFTMVDDETQPNLIGLDETAFGSEMQQKINDKITAKMTEYQNAA